MSFSAWRGIVGIIHPTLRPGALEEFIRLLPEGIGVVPLFLNIRRGTTDEFKQQMVEYERQIALAAEQGCDVIHPNGAPPFMVQGRAAETRVVSEWEAKYKTPIFTSGQNHIAALRALGATKILGATYFAGDINKTFAAYFEDAGFDVLAMDGVDVHPNHPKPNQPKPNERQQRTQGDICPV
jgi:maleate cis-trans isomerase